MASPSPTHTPPSSPPPPQEPYSPPMATPLPLPTLIPIPPPPSRRLPPPCWTPEETTALIDSYRHKWYSLRRGNLRAAHWQEVADSVHLLCPSASPPKTAVQCRHKMEKLRKRYRADILRLNSLPPHRLSSSSSWPYFHQMHSMELGPTDNNNHPSSALVPVSSSAELADDVRDDDSYHDRDFNGNALRIKFPGSSGSRSGFGIRSKRNPNPNPSFNPNPNMNTNPRYGYGTTKYGSINSFSAPPPQAVAASATPSQFEDGVRYAARVSNNNSGNGGNSGVNVGVGVDVDGMMMLMRKKKRKTETDTETVTSSGKKEREREREGKGEEDGDVAMEMVEAIRTLGEGFVRMEKMKMDMMRETERMRMDMEMKRTQMILESQHRIVEAFAKGWADNLKNGNKDESC